MIYPVYHTLSYDTPESADRMSPGVQMWSAAPKGAIPTTPSGGLSALPQCNATDLLANLFPVCYREALRF